jgi:hypothetical protein
MCSFCPWPGAITILLFSNNKFTGSMLDQLFTYYIENSLVIIFINSGSWGRVMVIRLDIEIWEIGKGGTKKRGGKKG